MGRLVCISLTCFVAAVISLIGGFVGSSLLDAAVAQGVDDITITRSPSSPAFTQWTDPAGVFLKVYVLNITNPVQFAAGELVQFNEVGPFVYEDHKRKINPQWDFEADTVSYAEQDYNVFRPDLSVASDDFVFTTLNLALWGAVEETLASGGTAQFGLYSALSSLGWGADSPHLYTMRHSVRDVLFGYNDTLLGVLSKTAKSQGITVDPAFPGLVPNATTAEDAIKAGRYVARIGATDASAIGQLLQWNGQDRVTWCPVPPCPPNNVSDAWGTPAASRVSGTDGSGFGQDVKLGASKAVWVGQLRRTGQLLNVNNVKSKVKDVVDTIRFELNPTMLMNETENPANAAFFMNGPHGMMKLDRVYQHVPLVASRPHFLGTDARLEAYARSIGLDPAGGDYDTYIDVEPMTGVSFNYHKRLMFSLETKPMGILNNQVLLMPNMTRNYVPIMWVDENGAVSDDDAHKFASTIYSAQRLARALPYAGIIASAVFAVVGGILFAVHLKRANREHIERSKITDYSSLR